MPGLNFFFANPGLNDACGDTYLPTGQSWLGRCACRLPYRPTEPWHRQLFRCALLAAGQVAPYPCVFSLGTVLYVPCTFWLYICLPRTPVCEVTLTPVSEVGGTLGTYLLKLLKVLPVLTTYVVIPCGCGFNRGARSDDPIDMGYKTLDITSP